MSETHNKLVEMRKAFVTKRKTELLNYIQMPPPSKDEVIDQLEKMKNYCHKMAGSAGTFGFGPLGEEMKKMELDLISDLETKNSTSEKFDTFRQRLVKILKDKI